MRSVSKVDCFVLIPGFKIYIENGHHVDEKSILRNLQNKNKFILQYIFNSLNRNWRLWYHFLKKQVIFIFMKRELCRLQESLCNFDKFMVCDSYLGSALQVPFILCLSNIICPKCIFSLLSQNWLNIIFRVSLGKGCTNFLDQKNYGKIYILI